MTFSVASHGWIRQILVGLVVCYTIAVAANDSDKLSTLRDNHLQLITTEPEVEVCQGETVSFIFNVTIPANLTPDRMYERTVWSPHKKDHCVIFRNISKCHGAEDFIQRAEISETWSPVSQGGHTQHGKLMFQLNNVSMGDAGYYEGELKTEYHINNVNARLIVKACPHEPGGGDTDTVKAKTDPGTEWRKGFGAGFGTCLGLVLIGGLTAKIVIWQCRKKDEKPPVVPI